MTEEKNQDKETMEQPNRPELSGAITPEQDGVDQTRFLQVPGSDEVPAPKKRVATRKKKLPEGEKQVEAVVSAAVEEATVATEQEAVKKPVRRRVTKKTQPEEDAVAKNTIKQQQPESESQPTLNDSAQNGVPHGTVEAGVEGSQDSTKPVRRRATAKQVINQTLDGETPQVTAESGDSPVDDKHDKKTPRRKQGAYGAKSAQPSKKVPVLSFSESVACFVKHYHQVVTCLDDLSFRDALAKLHGHQSHWKPQLEEAISVFLDEALYVEEGMSLTKLRRTFATASDLWGAAHAAGVHTQGHFMRSAQVVARLMQSLGEIMQLDFVVPVALEEAFKAIPASQDSVVDAQVDGEGDATSSGQQKTADSAPSSHAQQEEHNADTLLGVLQPLANNSSSNLLENAQKRFTEMAARVRQYSQSGVAQSSSYGYLVGAFYAELTVIQLALLAVVERQQQQDKADQSLAEARRAQALLRKFKSELSPMVRAAGVFSAESDKRRGRGQSGMFANESITALLAVMRQSVSTSTEPNHNSQQSAGQGYFQPPDLD